jgi:integrase
MARKALKLRQEPNGKAYSVYFWHPLWKRTERIRLGKTAATAETNLRFLNAIFLHPDKWEHPPEDTPIDILRQWQGIEEGVELTAEDLTPGKAAIAAADAQHWKMEFERVRAENRKLRKMLERERGKKLRDGPSPTLRKALDSWLSGFKGKDPNHIKNVKWDLERFVKHFKPDTLVDDIENRETELQTWLAGLETKELKDGKGNVIRPAKPISAGRRQQIRRHVLRFLEDAGAMMNRKGVATPKKSDIRRDRGAIRWLEKDQMDAVAAALADDWKDVFLLQCDIGLRPSEIPTLKRADLQGDCETLHLSPLGTLTLKTGSRQITVARFPVAQEVLKRRAEQSEILFTFEGKPWNLSTFCKRYVKALNSVKAAAKVPFRLDARIGRRTCASQLIRKGKSIEAVSALLGDDPGTVREHYGKLMSHEI